MIRVIIIEDDPMVADLAAGYLEGIDGFSLEHTAHSGEEGLALLRAHHVDLVLLDVFMPGMDGMELLREWRKAGRDTPVLILTARSSIGDKIAGLNAGGDDYLSKPFSFAELLARVQALIRRSTSASEPTRLTVGELSMNLLTREVSRGETAVQLQPREFALLEYFMRNPGKVLSKTMIMEHVWDYHFDPQTNLVDVLVCRLRNKIDRDYDRKMLHTLRGVGYVLKE